MASVEVTDRIATHNSWESRLSGICARQAREAHILATPPSGSSGVADMLVALGDVGIEVSQVVIRADHSGAYELMVSGQPEDAVIVLRGIECRASQLERSSIPDADRV